MKNSKRGWLCLNRKKDEKVVITTEMGGSILVKVSKLGHENVRLDFYASSQLIKINRSEVQEAIDAANQEVASVERQDQPQEVGQPGSAVGGSERDRS